MSPINYVGAGIIQHVMSLPYKCHINFYVMLFITNVIKISQFKFT
jgi:hypothetical protein